VLGVNNVLVTHGDYDTDKPNDYHHVTVVDVIDGIYETQDMPYKCEPLPAKSSNWFLMKHPDNKEWAIKENSAGELVSLFRNEHTQDRWVYTALSHSISLTKRIQAKENGGYNLVAGNKKTWKNASKAFSN